MMRLQLLQPFSPSLDKLPGVEFLTMRILVCLSFCLLLFAGQVFAFGQEGCGAGSCSDCHSLDVKEAGDLLQGTVDKILRVEFAEMPGVWLVEVEKDGQRFPLYIDFSKRYVVAGNIFKIPTKEERQPPKRVEHVDPQKIPLDGALLLGDPMAQYQPIVFTDPLCPYCARLHEELKKVVAEDPNIAFRIKLNPLDMHGQEAFDLARAVVCGQSLETLDASFKLINLHGQLLQLKRDPKADKQLIASLEEKFKSEVAKLTQNACETPAVPATKALAKELGLTGTPATVLPDGTVIHGVRKADELLKQIHLHGNPGADRPAS